MRRETWPCQGRPVDPGVYNDVALLAGNGCLEDDQGLPGIAAEAFRISLDDELAEQIEIVGPLLGRGAPPGGSENEAADVVEVESLVRRRSMTHPRRGANRR